MPLPYYVPDDEHFYQSVDQGGDLFRGYNDKIAEENAASTRAQGQMAANAISNLPQNYMNGADFSMRQGQQQQDYDIKNAEENRREQLFDPQLRSANLGADLQGESLKQQGIATHGMQSDYDLKYSPLSEEQASVYGGHAGENRAAMELAMNARQARANLGATQAGTAATQQGTATGAFNLGQAKLQADIGGVSPDQTQGPMVPMAQSAPMAQGGGTEPAPGYQLTDYTKGVPTAGPSAPQSQTLSDAQVNEIAKRNNTSPEAVRSAYRTMQTQRAQAQLEQQKAADLFRDTSPSNQGVRQQVAQYRDQLQKLNKVMANADQYKEAAKLGNGAWLANKVQSPLGDDMGWIESSAQKDLRSEAAQELASIGAKGEASEVMATGTGNVDERMRAAVKSAVDRKYKEIQDFINQNSQYASDPQVQGIMANLMKLKQSTGTSVPQVVPKGTPTSYSQAGYFR